MHPFALSKADDPAKAVAVNAVDAKLAFIAGGPDLIGLDERPRGAPRASARHWSQGRTLAKMEIRAPRA